MKYALAMITSAQLEYGAVKAFAALLPLPHISNFMFLIVHENLYILSSEVIAFLIGIHTKINPIPLDGAACIFRYGLSISRNEQG